MDSPAPVQSPSAPPPLPTPGRLVLHPYEGSPPTRADLAHGLGLQPDGYTYLVATAALERHRAELAPGHQREPRRDGEGEQAVMVFHRAIRKLLPRAPLSRVDEAVALRRAIEEAAAGPEEAAVLRHDAFTWRTALAELAGRGVDLREAWETEQARLVTPHVAGTLRGLQSAFRGVQAREGRLAFEEAARRFIREEYRPDPPMVVMEGFTFMTPLQRDFVEAALRGGARVHLVFPWRPGQRPGFDLLERTYGPYRDRAEVAPIHTPLEEGDTGLATLRRTLFDGAGPPDPAPAPDTTVTFTRYEHPHREVAGVIRGIQAALDRGVEPRRIAVVTRNAGEYDALLQEEAELRDLRAPAAGEGPGEPVRFRIPPRQLLLTPVGRFVLTLYGIWRDGELRMTADDFEAILASGWLGAPVQDTTEPFAAVRAQVFARCRTADKWRSQLARLARMAAADDSRLPSSTVADRTVRRWEETVDQVEALCRRLFSGPERMLGEHITLLLDELGGLAPEEMRATEREILGQVKEVLLEMAESASLRMNAAEFGEVLNGLVREYERADEDPGDPADPTSIWVTTPEGIDGGRRKVVFYLGVDNARVPRPFAEPWPMRDGSTDEHLDRERYLFLAVVRAAGAELHLSFSAADEERSYIPSPYLLRAAERVGAEVVTAETGVAEHPPVEPEPERHAFRPRRPHYLLSELAHFTLCPFRYKLERMDPRARNYRTEFQLRFLAQGVWLRLTLERVRDTKRAAATSAELYEVFEQAMRAVGGRARARFPGLGPVAWHEVATWVKRSLRDEAEYFGGEKYGTYDKRVRSAPTTRIVLPDERTVEVDASLRYLIQVGRFPQAFDGDLLHEEWLLAPSPPDEDDPEYTRVEEVRVFSDSYHAVQWWSRAARVALGYQTSRRQDTSFARDMEAEYPRIVEEVREMVRSVEGGAYPKNPGRHCAYCPVRQECLGLPERSLA